MYCFVKNLHRHKWLQTSWSPSTTTRVTFQHSPETGDGVPKQPVTGTAYVR